MGRILREEPINKAYSDAVDVHTTFAPKQQYHVDDAGRWRADRSIQVTWHDAGIDASQQITWIANLQKSNGGAARPAKPLALLCI